MSEDRKPCSRPSCENVADRAFCVGCEGRIRQAMLELPGLYDSLRGELLPLLTAGLRVSGTPDPPMPLRDLVAATIDDIEGWLRDQVQALRAARGWRALDLRRMRPRDMQVGRDARWLFGHLTTLLASEFGRDVGLELLQLHAACRVLLGLHDPPHPLSAPCFVCDRMALVRRNGESMVRCEPRAGGCGRTWSEQEYDWLVHASAAGLDDPDRHERELRPASGWDGFGGRG